MTATPFPREMLAEVVRRHRAAVAGFVGRGPLFELKNHKRRHAVDLTDLVLAGLLSGGNILLTGSSGTGKTFLAERCLRGLFGGTGVGLLNVTPGLDEDVLFDVDMGVQLRGGRLADSIRAGPLLGGWGLVVDDMYRAHPKLRNVLLAVLRAEPDDRAVSAKGGASVPIGRGFGSADRRRWFSVVATANPPRSGEFAGNYEADPAETRRFALIIDVDRVAPRAAEMRALFLPRDGTGATAPTSVPAGAPAPGGASADPDSAARQVIAVYEAVRRIPVSAGAELMALLAGAHHRCEKTSDGRKPWARLPDYCNSEKVKCAVARNEGTICPFVGELPPAAARDMIDVARAVAALEWFAAAEAGEDVPPWPEVRLPHVKAVYPFAAAQKVWLHRRFYEDPEKFNGDRESALRRIADAMQQEVTDFKFQNEPLVAAVFGDAAAAGPGARERLQRWARSRSPALAEVIASLLGLDLDDHEQRAV